PSAAKAFQGALLARPDFAVAQYNLAFALRMSGDFDRSTEAYRKYLATNGDDADAWFGYAETLKAAGDRIGAAGAYDSYAAVEKRSDHAKWIVSARPLAADLRAGRDPPALTPASKRPETRPPGASPPIGASSAAKVTVTRPPARLPPWVKRPES